MTSTHPLFKGGRGRYNAAEARDRILSVLEPGCGGARKFNVIAGLVGREVAHDTLTQLRREGLIKIKHRNGGPHYALTRKRA